MNKRLLALMLALVMLLGLVPAALAEAAIDEPAPALPGEAAALPGVGDVVNGFEVVELRDFSLLDATIVRDEHQKTGAELYYIANDDTNRAFDLTFFTDAIDDTGLPHVFEHATTAGSEKYPSSALFFNLSFQTYNTYMNAMTAKRYTTYPIASLSEAPLLKLADYYTDSCFHPMIMEDERIFRTEGWRYRLEDPEDELTIEGTVYSEMLGAWSLPRLAYTNALRAMFPGSLVVNESGGDPDFIPDMTWQMLKDYHDLYYHPSNCAAYLYGQFEDYAAFLELLDGYFSEYERKEFTRSDDGYAPISEPVVQTIAFPVEQGAGTEHTSSVYYGFVCPGLNRDTQTELVLNTLTDLLIDGASNFQQSLQEAIPYGSFAAYIEEDGPEDAIVFVASNVNAEDADLFKQTVDAALADVAENGFSQEQVDGVMASLQISALLIRENSDPVDGVIDNLVNSYAATGDPWNFLDYEDALFLMDEWNQQGLYKQAVPDWLIDSQTTALVATYPEPGAKEAKDAALAERLAEIKAGMSDEEIAGIVAATADDSGKEDAAELVAQLQAVTVESLPEELKLYEVTDETDDMGVRHIDAVAGVEGVGQASILLDAGGLAQEDILWFKLYTNLIGELDTEEHTKAELATLSSRYLYNGSIYVSVPEAAEERGYHPYLRMRWIALDEDLAEGYDLMRELMYDTKVDDPQKLLEQVQSLKAGMKSSITANPASVLLRRAMAPTSGRYLYTGYVSDLAYYDFLAETERLLQEDPDAAVAKLEGIKAYFNNRTNAVTVYAGNEASIALNRELADGFLAALDAREIETVDYDLPVPAAAEALIIDSGVQYNLLMADYQALGMEGYDASLDALASLVNDTFLIPLLRDQYGVYTPQHGAIEDGGVYVYAYRDPNIAETFAVLDELPEMVAEVDLDQETLDGYILSAYSYYAMPEGELTGAAGAAMNALEGRPQDEKLTWMRQLKQLTPEAVRESADMYSKLSDDGMRMTAGGAAAINANADLFDAIMNPFGAVDATQVAFDDVTEEHPLYEAVRFAFEEGLMDPAEEAAFGVDLPATNGDLLTAVYVLAGGGKDPQEALEVLADYGLVAPDIDLEAPIAPEDAWAMLSALVDEAVEPMTETAQPDAVTRGELAEMLMVFLNSMEG